MNVVKLSEYSTVISDSTLGEKIFTDIKIFLDKNESVKIDLSEVDNMTTFCAKQIFGRLFLELGDAKFFDQLEFEGASEDIKLLIEEGILNAINSSPKKV